MKADYGKAMHTYSTDLLSKADLAHSVPIEADVLQICIQALHSINVAIEQSF